MVCVKQSYFTSFKILSLKGCGGVRTFLASVVDRINLARRFLFFIKILDCNKTGQPILVGTTSIEKSEKISQFLSEKNLKHNILNAKFHEEEAKIISEAGKVNAITIATNMAGRGTDIVLGGRPIEGASESEKQAWIEKHDAVIKSKNLKSTCLPSVW